MALVFNGITGFQDTGTGALGLPRGTTAERPQSPVNGFIRYNTDLNIIEAYVNGSWSSYNLGTYSVEYLLIAGGGSGGMGGGGAGGVIYSLAQAVQGGTIYAITIGGGGSQNAAGGSSTFIGATAVGGGSNSNGGSGGGSSSAGSGVYGAQYSGTAGQGNRGGRGLYLDQNGDWFQGGGGGGGAGAAGTDQPYAFDNTAGLGGNGLAFTISGASVTYGGGGGGGAGRRTSPGGGGSGGGGNGGPWNQGNPAAGGNGTVNLGGGGGGSTGNTNLQGAGGAGVCIIRYPGAQRGTGGIITSIGGFTIHTFNSSGNYTA
jgi:hypothetical protein